MVLGTAGEAGELGLGLLHSCIPPWGYSAATFESKGRCRELRAAAAAAQGPGCSPTVPQDSQLCLLDPWTPIIALSHSLAVKGHLEKAWGFDTRRFDSGDSANLQEFPPNSLRSSQPLCTIGSLLPRSYRVHVF